MIEMTEQNVAALQSELGDCSCSERSVEQNAHGASEYRRILRELVNAKPDLGIIAECREGFAPLSFCDAAHIVPAEGAGE